MAEIAAASTAKVKQECIPRAGFCSVFVAYTAAAGETNTVQASPTSSSSESVRIVDSSATVRAGEGCVQQDTHTVVCDPGPPRVGVLRTGPRIKLRDRADKFSGSAARVAGGSGDDEIELTGGEGTASGGGGDDRLRGSTADDELRGNAGDDHLSGAAGDDALDGGPGADVIRGNRGEDRIRGRGGEDRLNGGRDDDVITGGGSADRILGGFGADALHGEGGDDRLFTVDFSTDKARCGRGMDSIERDASDVVRRSCEVVRLAARID